jgi:hypothetical protein
MAGVLQHLRSSTLDKRPNPASMVDGQVAINYASGSPGVFFKDANGSLVKVGPVHVGSTAPNISPASGGTAGNSIGEQWLDNSGGTYVFKIWDGSAWRSETGEFVNVTGDTMTGDLVMNNANLVFEGSVEDGFETTLTVVNPTADRTITLPNVTGTVVTTGDSGTVTSTMIADGTIVNADVNASAAIAGTKISPNFGSQTIQTTGIISAAGGSAAAPSIAFTGDTNTGIYSPGADQVAISTNGTGRLFVDASGNVGVGTASPGALLNLSSSANATLRLTDTAGSYADFIYNESGTVSQLIIDADPGNASIPATDILFKTDGSERLRITSDGKLGLGTSSPDNLLHLSANNTAAGSDWSSANNLIRIEDIDTSQATGQVVGGIAFEGQDGSTSAAGVQAVITANTNSSAGGGQLRFYTAATSTTLVGTEDPRLIIDGDGKLGLGTSNPQKLFELAANNNGVAENNTLRFTDTDTSAEANQQIGRIEFYSSDSSGSGANVKAYIGAFAEDTTPDAYLAFATQDESGVSTPVERLRIASDGNVGIGTTSPGGLLHVQGADNTASLYLTGATGTTARGFNVSLSQGGIYQNAVATLSAPQPNEGTLVFQTGASERARIDSSGRLGLGTSSPNERFSVEVNGTTNRAIEIYNGDTALADGELVHAIRFTQNDVSFPNTTHASIETVTTGSTGLLNMVFKARDNTEYMRINTQGRVGIGTVDPATLLHLSSATGSATPTPTELRLATSTDASNWSTTNPWSRISFYSADVSASGPSIHASIDAVKQGASGGDSRLTFSTKDSVTGNLTERLSITREGNVGIATTSPLTPLHVVSTSQFDPTSGRDTAGFYVQQSGGVEGDGAYGTAISLGQINGGRPGGAIATVQTTTDKDQLGLAFFTHGSSSSTDGLNERVRIDAGGKVGIGTTSPAGLLHVQGSSTFKSGTGLATLNIVSSANAADAGNKIAFFGADRQDADQEMAYIKPLLVSNNGGSGNIQLGHLTFGTSGSEHLRIDSSGRLLVGTSTTTSFVDSFGQTQNPLFEVSTSGNTNSSILLRWDSAGASISRRATFAFYRTADGTDIPTNTCLGEHLWLGEGSSAPVKAASISAFVDGTTGADDMPGRLVFSTTADGASSPTERMTIKSDGKVGLGTNAPESTLQVNGTVAFGEGAILSSSVLPHMYRSGGNLVVQGRTDGGAGGNIQLATASETRLHIAADGKVGIGTTSPGNKLSVVGVANATTGFTVGSEDGNASGGLYNAGSTSNSISIIADPDNAGANSNISFFIDSTTTEKARIDSSGRLLFGTSIGYVTSTSATTQPLLQIHSTNTHEAQFSINSWATGTATGANLSLCRSDSGTVGTHTVVGSTDTLGSVRFSGSDGDQFIEGASIAASADGTWGNDDGPTKLVFSTTADGASSPTPRVTIDNTGNTYFSSSGFDNRASAQATNGAGLKILSYSATATVEAEFFALSTSTRYAVAFSNPNGIVGSISTSASATAYNTSSDYRLKENVVPLTGAVDRLNQLQVHRFNFIADPSKIVDGFLAHEAQAVVPECVTGTKDEVDDEGNPVYQGIDQSKLVPLLTAALQEAIARIETLEAEVQQLKGQ